MNGIFTKYSLIRVGIILFALLMLSGTSFASSQYVAHAAASGGKPHNVTTADPTAKLNHGLDLGREVLPPNDGWASANGGTTGGAAATPDQVVTVTNREQLVQALGGDNTGADATPKIIYIKGVINGNEDDQDHALTCDSYITEGYSLSAYLATYDPAVWGRTTRPSGPLE